MWQNGYNFRETGIPLFAVKYWNHKFQCDGNCNLWRRRRKKYLGVSSPSPIRILCMPHIKTIQAENIVIYSSWVQRCITITLYWAISIQATSTRPAKRKTSLTQARMHWMFEICVGFLRWKHIALPHTCQRVGYIMMYNKWLNYFPIFSPMKSNIKAI